MDWKREYCIHLYGPGESPTRFCSGPEDAATFIDKHEVESVGVFVIEDDGECHGDCILICKPDLLFHTAHKEGVIDTACGFVQRGGDIHGLKWTDHLNKVTCPDCLYEHD